MSQSEWQEAVANHIAKSDDLTLCPGSELLSPIEKKVGDRSTHLFGLFSNVSFFLSVSDLSKFTYEANVLYVFEG